MPTTFRLADHTQIPNTKVVEIWYEGQFIGQLVPLNLHDAGVRIITKHAFELNVINDEPIGVIEVSINARTTRVPQTPRDGSDRTRTRHR